MRATWLWAAILLASGGAAFADEIQFKNGDRLTGTIQSLEDGKLMIDTAVGGKVSADLKEIKTFSTSGPVVVHLADGTVARQAIGAGPDGQVTVVPQGAVAPRTVDLGQIKQIGAPGPHWSGNITIGGFLARGNTNSESLTIGAHAERRSEFDRFTVDAGYIFGREHVSGHGTHETANDLFGELKYDYFFTEKFYGYGNVRAEHDTIAGLDLRLTPGIGIGYQWVETPKFSFNTEVGISYIHRSYAHDGSDDTVAARLAYHLKYKFNEKVGVFHDFEYFPGLDRIDNYFFDTDAGIRASLTDKMFAEFKIDYRYDSRPAPGRGSNDIRYIVGVGWTF